MLCLAALTACASAHTLADGAVPDAELDAADGPDAELDAADGNVDGAIDAGVATCMSMDDCEAVSVGAGLGHSCALMRSGRVACWGYNSHGQLARTDIEYSTTAVTISGLPTVERLSVRTGVSCGNSARELWCWGLVAYMDSSEPVRRVSFPPADATAIAWSGYCYLAEDGRVFCWGTGRASNLLGTGTTEPMPEPSVPVVGITDAVEIASGGAYECARRAAGEVACWGLIGLVDPASGLGTVALSPVEILTGAQQITAYNGLTCALRSGTDVECWGWNFHGKVGVGSMEEWVRTPTPVEFPPGTEIAQVSAGGSHACAVATDGHVFCWGRNDFGQLGVSRGYVDSNVPVQVQDIDSAVQVSAGSTHTCAVTRGGEVWCWGDNAVGGLGDGTMETRDYPVRVLGLR